MMGCSKTVFNRVSAGLVSQKYVTCVPQTNQDDSLKIDGPGGPRFHQLIRVLLDFISIRGATFLEESQKEPFQRYTGLIPEAGWHPPESGYQCFTDNEPCDASLWKINKSKGILAGGERFRTVTNLRGNGEWTHSG